MPAGTVLGALYSELMDEDDANLAPFPYCRGVQTPNGIGRLALQAQDSTIMQSGLGQDGFVSNAYFVKQHCLDPNGGYSGQMAVTCSGQWCMRQPGLWKRVKF